nr:MAG TPA: hypothetical protein [Caudoviricetes sp.]
MFLPFFDYSITSIIEISETGFLYTIYKFCIVCYSAFKGR